MPVTVIFSRPDGVEHARVTLTDQGQGGRATTLTLAGSAMTGTWRAKVHTDPKANPIAQASFLVEDFVPERLELKLEPAVQALSPQEPGTIKLAGRYLYGPPAAGLAVEGEIAVKLVHQGRLPGFAGYKFGLADEQVAPVRKPLEGLPATDADGKADIAVQLPALPKTNRPLEADVILKLRESGGRTIERTITLPVDLKAPRIGIKPLFTSNQAQEGEPARFEAIVLGADGKAVEAKGLKWELMRLDQRWQWYSRDGSWNYEPVTHTRRVATGTADATRRRAGQDRGQGRLGPLPPRGQHRRRLRPHLQRGVQRRLLRRRGRRQPRGARRRPRQAVLPGRRDGARQDRLAPGRPRADRRDELRPRQHAGGRSAGRRRRGADPRAATTGAPAPTSRVMLYRPMDEKAKRMPCRALGLRWLAVDQAPRMLNVSLDAPEKVKSGATLTVPVKVAGLAAGEEARITVAATDVGILNLTRFEAPKPQDWFFGQRRLGTEIRDVYGRLIDGMRAERGKLRSGGDGSRRRHVHAGQPAGRGDARAVLRHRQGRRRRHRAGRVPDARLQRHGAPLGRGLERRQGRLRQRRT